MFLSNFERYLASWLVIWILSSSRPVPTHLLCPCTYWSFYACIFRFYLSLSNSHSAARLSHTRDFDGWAEQYPLELIHQEPQPAGWYPPWLSDSDRLGSWIPPFKHPHPCTYVHTPPERTPGNKSYNVHPNTNNMHSSDRATSTATHRSKAALIKMALNGPPAVNLCAGQARDARIIDIWCPSPPLHEAISQCFLFALVYLKIYLSTLKCIHLSNVCI